MTKWPELKLVQGMPQYDDLHHLGSIIHINGVIDGYISNKN